MFSFGGRSRLYLLQIWGSSSCWGWDWLLESTGYVLSKRVHSYKKFACPCPTIHKFCSQLLGIFSLLDYELSTSLFTLLDFFGTIIIMPMLVRKQSADHLPKCLAILSALKWQQSIPQEEYNQHCLLFH